METRDFKFVSFFIFKSYLICKAQDMAFKQVFSAVKDEENIPYDAVAC